MVTQSNRERIEADYQSALEALHTRHEEIRQDDAALRAKRENAQGTRAQARNLRLALFALDGDVEKTHADADAAIDEALDALRED